MKLSTTFFLLGLLVFGVSSVEADWEITVNFTGNGRVTSSPSGIDATRSGGSMTIVSGSASGTDGVKYDFNSSAVTLTAAGIAPVVSIDGLVAGSPPAYNVNVGGTAVLDATATTAGTQFVDWTGFDQGIGSSTPSKSYAPVKPTPLTPGGPVTSSGSANFIASSIISYTWTIGNSTLGQTSYTETFITPVWNFAVSSLPGGFGPGSYDSKLVVTNGGSESGTKEFKFNILSGGGPAAVPEPGSLLLLSSAGLLIGASKRSRRKLLGLFGKKTEK